eukprot:PhF_6_TR40191/c0_g1_i1/m.59632/K17686/copA, ATP7; Cu+-exporting ATPase
MNPSEQEMEPLAPSSALTNNNHNTNPSTSTNSPERQQSPKNSVTINSDKNTSLVRVRVSGMSCTACSNYLEGKMSAVVGVKSCCVNFATGIADVVVASSVLEVAEVVESVRRFGFGCEEVDTSGDDPEGFLRANEEMIQRMTLVSDQAKYLQKLKLSLPLSVLITIIMVCSMKIQQVQDKMELCAALEMALSIPVVIYGGQTFFMNAWTALTHCTCTMDSLVALGVGTAMISSIATAITCWTHPSSDSMHQRVLTDMHFESAANLISIMLLGRYLESRCRSGTAKALVMLMGLQPKTAIVVVGQTEIEVSTARLTTGSLIVVRSGSSMPCDGVVERGSGYVDESHVTGEACPVEKQEGNRIICGTVLTDGLLYIRVTAVGAQTSLSHIVSMVQSAQLSKPAIQKYADMIAGRFVPTVIVLALVAFFVWLILGLTGGYPEEWRAPYSEVSFALNFFVATVLISCPCALGLATPTAILVGTGVGAQRGIIVKGGDVLESCSKVRAVVFDKTGTLTDGVMKVVSEDIVVARSDADLVGALAASSTHPAAVSVLEHLKTTDPASNYTTLEGVLVLPGKGVSYSAPDGELHLLGSAKLLEESDVQVTVDIKPGFSRLLYARGGRLHRVYYLKDRVRPEARLIVEELLQRNIDVHLLSGDVTASVEAVGTLLNIPPECVHAEVLPDSKTNFVQDLVNESYGGSNDGIVMFVGDGVNDAGALCAAHVGVAMASATDISTECADVALTRNNLWDVVTLIDLSITTMRRIRLNFCWATVYNFIALPLATGLLFPVVKVQVPPMLAGGAMIFSSLSVLTSSYLLKNFKSKQ